MSSKSTIRLCYNHHGTKHYITCRKTDKFVISMKQIVKLMGITNNLNYYRWLYNYNNIKPSEIIGDVLSDQDKEILVVSFNHSG